MRIVIAQAQGFLSNEIEQLKAESGRCNDQLQKLDSIRYGVSTGKSAQKAVEIIHAQKVAAQQLGTFCDQLAAADQKNHTMLAGLPNTSPGVIDTDEAREQIAAIRKEILRLQKAQEEAKRVYREAVSDPSSGVPLADRVYSYRGEAAAGASYVELIITNQQRISTYEETIKKAEEYAQATAQLYHGVSTNRLYGIGDTGRSLSAGKGWGDTWWISGLRKRNTGAAENPLMAASVAGAGKASQRVVDALKERDPKQRSQKKGKSDAPAKSDAFPGPTGGALYSDDEQDSSDRAKHVMDFLNYETSGEAEVGFFGATVAVGASQEFGKTKTSGGLKLKMGEKTKDGKTTEFSSVGFEESYSKSGYATEGHMRATWDGMEAEASIGASVGNFAAKGNVSAGMYDKDGNFDPHLDVGGSMQASLIEGKAEAKIADGPIELSVGAKGKVCSGKLEGGLSVDSKGVHGKAGAEAWLLEGQVEGSANLFGVKVNVVEEAKLGGGGVSAAFDFGDGTATLKTSAGLGVGVGQTVTVDYSEALENIENVADDIEAAAGAARDQYIDSLDSFWHDHRDLRGTADL